MAPIHKVSCWVVIKSWQTVLYRNFRAFTAKLLGNHIFRYFRLDSFVAEKSLMNYKSQSIIFSIDLFQRSSQQSDGGLSDGDLEDKNLKVI